MHVCRQLYPNDSFWTISNEFTREKKNWLQDGTIQRRYAVWVFQVIKRTDLSPFRDHLALAG